MGQNGAEQPTGLSVARKAPDSLKVPRNQENICGKDLTERSGENWTPAKTGWSLVMNATSSQG